MTSSDAFMNGTACGLAASGNPVDITGTDIVRVVDGKITEIYHVEELLKLTQQRRVCRGKEPRNLPRQKTAQAPPADQSGCVVDVKYRSDLAAERASRS